MAKGQIRLADGPTIDADILKGGLLAIHKPIGGGRGYVITHVPTGLLLLRIRLQRDAKTAAGALAAALASGPGALQAAVEAERARLSPP